MSLKGCLKAIIKGLDEKGISYRVDEQMKRYSTILIGGVAPIVVFPKTKEEVAKAVDICLENNVEFEVISGCSNTLFALDKGQTALISTKRLRGVEVVGERIKAYAGERLGGLIRTAALNGISGLESFVGVPAALGGALYMNFSCYNREICALVDSLELLKDGKVICMSANELEFSYRNGGVKKGEVILFATLNLQRADKREIFANRTAVYNKRRKSQPLSFPSLGCVYKNPKGISAGRLIDELGLKGEREGGARISQKHGAFIINMGGANADDVLKLIDKTKNCVYNRIGIELQTEIGILH